MSGKVGSALLSCNFIPIFMADVLHHFTKLPNLPLFVLSPYVKRAGWEGKIIATFADKTLRMLHMRSIICTVSNCNKERITMNF